MSTPPLEAPPLPASPSRVFWQGWPEVRQDLRGGTGLLLGLGLAGLPAGVLWWLLAPKADYRVTDAGPVPVGPPVGELQAGDDAVLVLLLLGLGLLAGLAAWLRRRTRGVGTLAVLAAGGSLASVVAWQLGELLRRPPTEAELADVGTVVTTGLTLGSLPGLAATPFAALLAYLCCAILAADDGLGRE
ncbi:LPXTG cell wall anchor domain-containing protein [Blastococcus sp. TF02A-35]|uniref:LPXTG cell wall anchor domain-containing protein n=1 Tax=Blastococcus sp. TF02A-35 TaxID=2559612 RepID=UPI001074077B|nr:LPXTG cell wall anchor domain-containing protein [Blastococcus sp. TF02A_35]TFV50292.1 LPXTG cell wall anchor domain-containing protein [Blastococcus sp. TF02A_35]